MNKFKLPVNVLALVVIAAMNCPGEDTVEIKEYPLREGYSGYFGAVPEDTIRFFSEESDIREATVYGFTVYQIGIFEAKTNQYDGLPSCDPLEHKLKKRICEAGGNAWTYVSGVEKKDTQRCVSISYKVFRVEWKGNPSIPAPWKNWEERAEMLKAKEESLKATEAFEKHPHYLKRQEIEKKVLVQFMQECFGLEVATSDIKEDGDMDARLNVISDKPLEEFTESQRKLIQNCFGIKGESGMIKNIIANLPDQEKRKFEQTFSSRGEKAIKSLQAEFRKLAKAYPQEYEEFKELYRKADILLSSENDDLRDITNQKRASERAAILGLPTIRTGMSEQEFLAQNAAPKKTLQENEKNNAQTTVSDPFLVSGVSEVTLTAEEFSREKIESLIRLWQKKKMLDKETAKYVRMNWSKREKICLKRSSDGKITPSGRGQKP